MYLNATYVKREDNRDRLIANYSVPEEHLIHSPEGAQAQVLSIHWSEGANCESFATGGHGPNCATIANVSLDLKNRSDIVMSLSLQYNHNRGAAKEWRIRVDIPRYDCDAPLKYLLIIPPGRPAVCYTRLLLLKYRHDLLYLVVRLCFVLLDIYKVFAGFCSLYF